MCNASLFIKGQLVSLWTPIIPGLNLAKTCLEGEWLITRWDMITATMTILTGLVSQVPEVRQRQRSHSGVGSLLSRVPSYIEATPSTHITGTTIRIAETSRVSRPWTRRARYHSLPSLLYLSQFFSTRYETKIQHKCTNFSASLSSLTMGNKGWTLNRKGASFEKKNTSLIWSVLRWLNHRGTNCFVQTDQFYFKKLCRGFNWRQIIGLTSDLEKR